MVSDVMSVRLWSQQAALKAFKDVSGDSASGSSSSSDSSLSLADILFPDDGDDDDGYDDTSLSNLIASLQQQAADEIAAEDASEGSVDDISSTAFMKSLREKLEALKNDPTTGAMADAMLQALDAGALTVTNAVTGEQILAWDASDTEAGPQEKTATDKADWSTFLKQHAERDSEGRYVRNEDSSLKEKTGASAYFGMIGDTYYYLSWTVPAASADAPASSPASAEE